MNQGAAPRTARGGTEIGRGRKFLPVLALTVPLVLGGLTCVAQAVETSAAVPAASESYVMPSLPLSGEQLVALRNQADRGDTSAMILLGRYHSGHAIAADPVTRKLDEGLRWFEKAAGEGDASAMASLGFLYLSRLHDDAGAVEWFRKAAAHGNAAAMSVLTLVYAQGRGVLKNEAQSFAWAQKSAKSGDKFAAKQLAEMYLNGTGTPPDAVQAARWYRRAADKGLASAMFELSSLYSRGLGVAKDQSQAFEWAMKSAQADFPSAMYVVGARYNNGVGVAANPAEAKRWFERAADAGEAEAMFALSVLYGNGIGVTAAPGVAADWMVRAIRAGSFQAPSSIMREPAQWSQAFREALQKRLRAAGVYQGAVNGKIDVSVGHAIATLNRRAATHGQTQQSPSDTIVATKTPDHAVQPFGVNGPQGPRPSAAGAPTQAGASVPMSSNAWIRVAPHVGHVHATSQGLVLEGGAPTGGQLRNGRIDGNRVRSREHFNFGAGGNVYMAFVVDGGGKYMAIYPRLVAGVSVRHMSTHNSWAGSVVVPDRAPLFGHLRIEPGGNYRLTIARGGYDDHGGRVLQQANGTLPVLSAPLEFQFGDNHAGTAAHAVITEAWVHTGGVATQPIAPSPAAPPGGSCSTDADCPGSICLLGVCAPPSPRSSQSD